MFTHVEGAYSPGEWTLFFRSCVQTAESTLRNLFYRMNDNVKGDESKVVDADLPRELERGSLLE